MKSILAALATSVLTLKDGQTFSHHEITLSKDGVAGDPVSTTDPSITFEDLEPGSYVATGFSVLTNADGTSENTPSVTSEALVVEPDATGTADVLSSITLSLAPVAPPVP